MARCAGRTPQTRKAVRRFIVCALLAAAGSRGELSTFKDSPSELAKSYAKKAKRARKAGHPAQAYILYSEATALEPNKKAWRIAMQQLQAGAVREEKSSSPAADAPSDTPGPDVPARPVFDSMTQREMADARPLEDAERLRPTPGAQEFDLNGDARNLWDTAARRFGLDAVYDSDYPKTGPPIRFRIDRADYRDALHDLEAATSSFVIPLSSRIFMVASDTPQKRQQLEQTLTLAVPIPSAMSTQDLTEIAQAVRQVIDVQKIAWNSSTDQLVMRDRVSHVLAAQALLQQLIALRAETLIDVEYLEVSSSDLANYGFNVANQFSAFYLGSIFNNVASIPSGITNLITFGGGKTLVGLTAAEVQALFNETISTSNLLYRSQLRVRSGEAATFHAGERYPVVTAGYFGSVPANEQSQVYTPPPSFTYEDLGIQMKLTPHVHGMDDMTISIELTYEVLSGQANNGIPILGSRKIKTDARIRDGEWTVVAGMTTSTRSKSVNGFWALADLPLLGNAFKQTSTDKESAYVLIALRPHLLSLPPDQIPTRAIAFGSETRDVSPL